MKSIYNHSKYHKDNPGFSGTNKVSLLEQLHQWFEQKEYHRIKEMAPVWLQESNSEFYDIKKVLIMTLLVLEEIDEALSLVEEELTMPYIPEPYHTFFHDTYQAIHKRKLQQQKPINPFFQYPDHEINELLLTSDNNDVLLMVIQELSRRNIRLFLPSIFSFLLSKSKKNYFKVSLLEILQNQGISQTVKIWIKGLICEVIPTDLTPLLMVPSIQEIMSIIRQVDDKNQSIDELSETLLIAYLASFYPLEISEEENYLIAAAIYWQVNHELNIKLSLEEVASRFKVKPHLLEQYQLEISDFDRYF